MKDDELNATVAAPLAHRAAGVEIPHAHAPAPPTVAVIVAHGMGQQVPYETLDCVAKALVGQNDPQPRVRVIRFGQDSLVRAELELTRGAEKRLVHLYEIYWAPLTEGKVGILEAAEFLLAGGWRGFRYSLMQAFARRPVFRRWLFGAERPLPIGRLSLLQFGAAVAVVLSLALIYAAFMLSVGQGVPVLSALELPEEIRCGLRSTLALYTLLAGLLGNSLLLVAYTMRRFGAARPADVRRYGLYQAICSIGLYLVFLVTILAGIAVSATLASRWWPGLAAVGELLDVLLGSFGGDVLVVLANRHATQFILALAIPALVARYFLIQYVGDVAVYVAAHKVSKFQETRDAIQAVSRRVARAVYSEQAAQDDGRLYDEVVFVGHSLGSVVAYDALNTMLNLEQVSRGVDVKRRTKMLITFGSPLDKTAFLFRTQIKGAVVREAMAAAKQPLIVDYAYRERLRWVNIYSPADWISGPLEYYDHEPPAGRGVVNVRDRESFIPLVAHVEYWRHGEFRRQLLDGIFR
jgi:hypothetical protein